MENEMDNYFPQGTPDKDKIIKAIFFNPKNIYD